MYPQDFKQTFKIENNDLTKQIKIIDNFLPNYDEQYFMEKFKFLELESNYKPFKSYIGSDIHKNCTEYDEIIENIIFQANLFLKSCQSEIKQIVSKVLLVSDLSSAFSKHRHVDDSSYFQNGYTLSYHWMGENNAGGTAFFPDFNEPTPLIQVPFKPNRLVIFPSRIPHEGYANKGTKNLSRRFIITLFTELM